MAKSYAKECKTCNNVFTTSRSHTVCCSRLCHRRSPENRTKYNGRVKEYQHIHAKDPKRKHQKLIFKAKFENREMSLSLQECENYWNSGCIYCSKILTNETGCGLDRLDNNEGYIKTNVVPCCGKCNQIRNNHLTHDEMKIAMNAVLEYRRNHVNTK